MKKLKLEPETLRVETFEPERASGERGTVRGHASSAPYACQFMCFSGVTACMTQCNCPSNNALCRNADTCTCSTAATCPTDENTCNC